MSLNIQKAKQIGLKGMNVVAEIPRGLSKEIAKDAQKPHFAIAWQLFTGVPADVISLSAKSYTVCEEPYTLLTKNFVKTIINKFKVK